MAAAYRQIYITFWNDEFITTLTSEEKLFYIYLLTNQYVSFSGIYLLTIKMMSLETGLSVQKIKKMLKILTEHGKVVYSFDTDEVCLCNFLKYNSNKSPNQIKGLKSSLERVKDRNLLKSLQGLNEIIEAPSETPSLDTTQTPTPTKEQINKRTITNKQQQEHKIEQGVSKKDDDDVVVKFDIVKYFSKTMPIPNATWKERLIAIGEDDYPDEWLKEAVDRYFLSGTGKPLSYLERILANWKTLNSKEPWKTQWNTPPPNSDWNQAQQREKRKTASKDCKKCKGEGFIHDFDDMSKPTIECDCWGYHDD